MACFTRCCSRLFGYNNNDAVGNGPIDLGIPLPAVRAVPLPMANMNHPVQNVRPRTHIKCKISFYS